MLDGADDTDFPLVVEDDALDFVFVDDFVAVRVLFDRGRVGTGLDGVRLLWDGAFFEVVGGVAAVIFVSKDVFARAPAMLVLARELTSLEGEGGEDDVEVFVAADVPLAVATALGTYVSGEETLVDDVFGVVSMLVDAFGVKSLVVMVLLWSLVVVISSEVTAEAAFVVESVSVDVLVLVSVA